MPYNQDWRNYRTKRITMANKTTTTEIKATTSVFCTAYAVGDYKEMTVSCHVLANASAAHGLYLQESIDGGTTWGAKHTLDADMTTTANYTLATLTTFGDTVRVFAGGATTSSSCRFTAHAILKR